LLAWSAMKGIVGQNAALLTGRRSLSICHLGQQRKEARNDRRKRKAGHGDLALHIFVIFDLEEIWALHIFDYFFLQ
jgi:hypothetical protein